MIEFYIAGEGLCDILAASKIIKAGGHDFRHSYNCRGKSNLDKRLESYHRSSVHLHWFVLRDLGMDAECAPVLVSRLLKGPLSPNFIFRIAVRSLECWLMADADNLSDWLRVSKANLPRNADETIKPKDHLARIAQRSGDRELRNRMAPDPLSGARVGPEYEAALYEFIRDHWNPTSAERQGRSPSLNRALNRLRCL